MAPPSAEPLKCQDPWRDPKWSSVQWTVYRGAAYDLTDFIADHPGGSQLASLAVGRDCTALVETYHLRCQVAIHKLQSLPKLEGFPCDAVPAAPYPNDSEVYTTIRQRVRQEVFKGTENTYAHKKGAEASIVSIFSFALAAYLIYIHATNFWTGMLLGVAGAWLGVGIQHAANHGAMSVSPLLNAVMGLANDLIGGSSLVWRYHHQVSHHIHTNDEALDEDVHSMHPLLRYDKRLPRYWHHQFQHLLALPLFTFMHLAYQYGDMLALVQNRSVAATFYGAATYEKLTIILGKVAHFALLFGVPTYLSGVSAALAGTAGYSISLSLLLACMFLVSHNTPETIKARNVMASELVDRDWGVQQIVNSVNWGGRVANFFTGGLNLQIEHHLFPAVCSAHYPAIQAIIRDECAKRDLPYNQYSGLHTILPAFLRFMKDVGAAPQQPPSHTAAVAVKL